MSRRALATVVPLVAALAAPPRTLRAEIFGTTFRSPAYGVEMTLPRGWEISEQTSYPGVLARAYEHKSKARITLAVQALSTEETPKSFLERSAANLRRLGYEVSPPATHAGGALIVEARTRDRKRVVRQAYVARDQNIFVLSMGTDAGAAPIYVRQFEETLRSLAFTIAAPPPPETMAP